MDHQFIKVYSMFPDHLCEELIEVFDTSSNVSQGLTGAGKSDLKVSSDLVIDDSVGEGLSQQVLKMFDRVKDRYLEDFSDIFGMLGFDLKPELPKMKKYPKGSGKYDRHVDVSPRATGRQLVCIAYLNDVDSGGMTVFPDQDTAITPITGDVLVFPTFWTFPHESTVVKSHDKYMVSTFYHAG